eukprot:CAMPEP_0179170086 /NCGR_PEP_ID=MMETSP0796-20121207/83768_1 /TAXON_ID=73915 /ORGANISM="Pyrodinium bahamense, Strain pbaha01" /LENGTH=56 /DNA_ID=CAMNT_0020873025 /DNA_START=1 /DNA_END=168 /DNA_ORIENTATION=+
MKLMQCWIVQPSEGGKLAAAVSPACRTGRSCKPCAPPAAKGLRGAPKLMYGGGSPP